MPDEPELLISGSRPDGRGWVWGAGLAAVVVAGVLVLHSSDGGPDAAVIAGQTTASSSGATATATSTATTESTASTGAPSVAPFSVPPEDLVTGSLPITTYEPSFGTAIQAARLVVDAQCTQVESWGVTFESTTVDYIDFVVRLDPSPSASISSVELHLSWLGDHFDWAASRSQLDAC